MNDILMIKASKVVSFTKVSIHCIPSQNSEKYLPLKRLVVPSFLYRLKQPSSYFSNNRWFVSKIIFKIAGCVILPVAIMASKFSNFPSTKVILSANLGSIAVIYLARKAVNVDR
jgi:uncharacterized membrane protein